MTELSVLIVNYNSWRVCASALRTLRACPPMRADGSPMSYEIIVVDNASPIDDPKPRAAVERQVKMVGGRVIMHDENGGYSKGMNLAYAHAKGDWILVSNPDVQFKPDCLSKLIRRMEADPSIGAAAPVGYWDEGMDGLLPPNILPTLSDLLRLAWCSFSIGAVRRYSKRRTRDAVRVWRATQDVELDMLSGCCFLMHRSFIEQIDLFDERFPLYYEDTDLSVRVRKAGKRIVQVAGARLVHLYNRSGQTDHDEAMRRYRTSRRAYYAKWYGRPGALIYDATCKVLDTELAKRRRARAPHEIHELGSSETRPTIRLDQPCSDLLVEISLDPHFFLAAGTFGSGSSWTPTTSLFLGFGPTTYYFRLVDLSQPDFPQIGVYRFTLTAPTQPAAVEGEVGVGSSDDSA